MGSIVDPKLQLSIFNNSAFQALPYVALTHFTVAIISNLWSKVPLIPWYWWPVKTDHGQIDVADTVGELLPSEKKSKKNKTVKPGGYQTLAKFRLDEDFPLEDALEEYHLATIPYAIALAEIEKEVCKVAYQTNATKYFEVLAKQRLDRQRYYQLIDGGDGTLMMMSLQDVFTPGQAVRILDNLKRIFRDRSKAIFQKILNLAGLQFKSEISTSSTTVNWIDELAVFRKNVIDFCKYAGSRVDENAPLQDIIQSLRTYAAEGKQLISPLFEQNAKLREELEHSKRIRAALQIRHIIERLIAELPKSKGSSYDIRRSGPKWMKFWEDVWKDAQTNPENPFNKLFVDAKDIPYVLKNINQRGTNLYSEMSQDIHGFWGKADIECAYFDDLTKKIAQILWPTEIETETREPIWELEIKKYPYKREE